MLEFVNIKSVRFNNQLIYKHHVYGQLLYDKHIRFHGALILLEKIFFLPRKLCYYYSSSLFSHDRYN
jgi:hypothetical protein